MKLEELLSQVKFGTPLKIVDFVTGRNASDRDIMPPFASVEIAFQGLESKKVRYISVVDGKLHIEIVT